MSSHITTLGVAEAYAVLLTADTQFIPNLSASIDIEQYALKLSQHARFALCREGARIKAAVAFYHNEIEGFIYIPFVWTDRDSRKQGLSRRLLGSVHDWGSASHCTCSRLEVRKDNPGALALYTSMGYEIEEDHGTKYLLQKTLPESRSGD